MYPCPVCGYLTFAEPPGSYEICPVCGWEDDALQLEFATTLAGGANSLTLFEQRSTTGARRSGIVTKASERGAAVHNHDVPSLGCAPG